jgi:ElaB/YqjD/DUF883 family membrane-anchored ribosome-binding protein
MSELSFKQARDLAERLELSEVTLNKTLSNIQRASDNFNSTLKKQEELIQYIPKSDDKINLMKIIVALNIGFVLGLLVSKYLF